MKTTLISLACLTALSAHATNYPPTPTTTNQAGAIAGAAALSRSSVRNTSTTTSAGGAGGSATGGAASITGQMNMQGATLGGGGAGGSLGNVTAGGVHLAGARIGSDVTMERSAPSIYGATPTQPTQPCARPGFSIGGSSKDGSGLLSIPTGTDVTCRVDNALTIMSRNPALFTAEDRLRVSCKQEDIAETATCKALAERDAKNSAGTTQAVTSASLQLLP